MKVGDKVKEWIMEATLTSFGKQKKQKKEGTVISIHPEGRFYRVEFQFNRGKFIEAFPMEGGSLYDD